MYYYKISDNIVKLSKAETLATIIQNRLSKRKFQRIRNRSIKSNANIYQSYNATMEYRNKFCTPKPIEECFISENEFITPMQDGANHQLTKLFQLKPELKNNMIEKKKSNPGVKFEGGIKWGMYPLDVFFLSN